MGPHYELQMTNNTPLTRGSVSLITDSPPQAIIISMLVEPPVTDMNINISLKAGSGMRYKTTLACV